jgi:hypothetical protein
MDSFSLHYLCHVLYLFEVKILEFFVRRLRLHLGPCLRDVEQLCRRFMEKEGLMTQMANSEEWPRGNLQGGTNKIDDEMARELLWVLIEGPAPGDAEFLGRWLLAAVQADQTLQEQLKKNPTLKQQIDRLEVEYMFSFAPAATRFVELLMKNLAAFSLEIWGEWGEVFTVMADLGFFRLTGDRYQMTIPQAISGSRIEAALLRLAATEDQEYLLHPERLVSCLSKLHAENWQLRLEGLPWMQRVADRTLLLEGV